MEKRFDKTFRWLGKLPPFAKYHAIGSLGKVAADRHRVQVVALTEAMTHHDGNTQAQVHILLNYVVAPHFELDIVVERVVGKYHIYKAVGTLALGWQDEWIPADVLQAQSSAVWPEDGPCA